MKGGKFLDQVSQEGLSSVGLVRWLYGVSCT